MPTCNEQIIKDNEDQASETGPYGGVRIIVNTVALASKEITFTVFDSSNPNGKICSAVWGDLADMWPACPSTLPSQATADDPGPPPAVGTTGILYLSVAFLGANGIVAPPKWPKALGTETHTTLRIWPTSVVLTGIELVTGDMTSGTIDLLDLEFAQAGQILCLGEHPIEVRLTEPGLRKFAIESHESSPWSRLSDAIANIEAEDPGARALAWGTIAACMDRLPLDHEAGLVTSKHLQDLCTVLPNHAALIDFKHSMRS
jgi:hypothetical protein